MTATSKSYVENCGAECPNCGSGDITNNGCDYNGTEIAQEVSCGKCNHSWTDIYELKGYRSLVTPDGDNVSIPK